MSIAERRAMLSAALSLPLDNGDLATLPGERMAGLRTSTRTNAGFSEASFQLLGNGFGEYLPIGQAQEVRRRWFKAVIRIQAQGETVWVGRVWDRKLYDHINHPALGIACRVQLECRGLALTDLTSELPPLPGSFTEEDATVTLSDLVIQLVDTAVGSIIAKTYGQVAESAVNLGPVPVSDQDLPLDLIVNDARAGNADNEEMWFGVFEPEYGPVLQAICADGTHRAASWQHSIIGTGLELTSLGDEAANRVAVVFADEDNSTGSVDPAVDLGALELQGGIRRTRTISVNGIGNDGAAAAALVYLAVHRDPLGFEGGMRLAAGNGLYATLTNAEGQLEPAWRARCGQVIRLLDALPHDPEQTEGPLGVAAIIEATEVDWDSGDVTLTLDQRPLRSRLSEDQARVRAMIGALEPGMSRKLLVQAVDTSEQSAAGSVADLSVAVTFRVARRCYISIRLSGTFYSTSTSGGDVYLGYRLDGEDADNSDANQRIHDNYGGDTSVKRAISSTFTRLVQPGEHTVQVWQDGANSAMRWKPVKVEVFA